jgi:hypothetical protein
VSRPSPKLAPVFALLIEWPIYIVERLSSFNLLLDRTPELELKN